MSVCDECVWCVAGPDCSVCFLLSDVWGGRAELRCIHDGELQDDRAHSNYGELQLGQHAAGQRHHHHVRFLSGLPGRSEGEPLSPPDGTAHIALLTPVHMLTSLSHAFNTVSV